MLRRTTRTLVLALATGALLTPSLGSAAAAPPAGAPAAASPTALPADLGGATGRGAHVVAVGDIAYPGGPYDRTAALVAGLDPRRVLLAGDLAYPRGTARQFARLFDPDWGRFRRQSLPVPGNHEYGTPKAAGYRSYFEERGGLWWSRKVGAWRVVGLDSERLGSARQRRWLTRSLERHDGVPTLVMWHRPRFSRGEHGDQRDTAALYRRIKRDPDVKLLVWGHDHHYERMEIPVQARSGALPAFVVGTGGAPLRCGETKPGRSWSHVFDCTSHGVLDLRLRPRSFSWAFLGIDGRTLDGGTSSW